MIGLLIKDIRLIKGQNNYFIGLLLLSLLISMTTSSTTFAIGFCSLVGVTVTLSTISYDEFNNGNRFLFTLPFNRKTYVIEKYILGVMFSSSFWFIGTVISLVGYFLKEHILTLNIFIEALSLLPMAFLLLVIMLPFQLKYGGEKGKIVLMGVIGFFLVIGLLTIKVLDYLGINILTVIDGVMLNTTSFFLIIVLFFIILLVVSIKSSVFIIQKKEF